MTVAKEDKNFCFVISPIGDPGTPTRDIADGVLKEIIEPALEDDFHVERADHVPAPGIVTDQIIENLIEADLVVADLSDHNPNVMYELAIRHSQEKPFVQIAQEGTDLPFDIAPVHVVFYNPRLKGRSDTVEDLREAARKAMTREAVGNPIGSAVRFMEMTRSGSPEERALAEAVQELRSEFATLRRQLSGDQGRAKNVRRAVESFAADQTPDFLQLIDMERIEFDSSNVTFTGSGPQVCNGCGEKKPQDDLRALYVQNPEWLDADAILCSDCLRAAETDSEFARSVLKVHDRMG